VLGKQPLLAFGFDGAECAVAGFPNAQGRHGDARGFRHGTDAVQGVREEGAGVQNVLFE